MDLLCKILFFINFLTLFKKNLNSEGASLTYGGKTNKTDKSGLCSFGNSSVNKVHAIAVKDEDVAFYPSIYHAPSVTDDHVWFTFDDRKLYKPKETVNVKGYVRHLKHVKDTVVPQFCSGEVQWTVYDPRGAQLETGKTNLNSFGSFDFKFTLKDNVNLGNGRVFLKYKAHSFTHSFQIQEFRRPEFEAKCSYSPQSDHICSNDVGGFLVSSVNASYFAGGNFFFNFSF